LRKSRQDLNEKSRVGTGLSDFRSENGKKMKEIQQEQGKFGKTGTIAGRTEQAISSGPRWPSKLYLGNSYL
jgi:hypothetical protein